MIAANALEHIEIDDCILILYKWGGLSETSSPRIWENVEFFDKNGRKLWTVNGMDDCPYWDKNIDMFVSIGNDGASWILNSYSGHSFFLDMCNGYVKYKGFHK